VGGNSSSSQRSHRWWLRWEILAAAAGLVLLAGSGWAATQSGYITPRPAGIVPGGPPSGNQPPWAAGTPNPATAGSASGLGYSTPTATPTPATAPRPHVLRLEIPALKVSAPVQPVGILPDGTLGVPADPRVVGWWRQGAAPGEEGTVVLDGHVDTAEAGPGALFYLDRLPMGSAVLVQTDRGTFTYRVVGRRVYRKTALPASVFDQATTPRLVLVTCGGPFDRKTGHYADNVVVYAVPAER